jgi:hypothetical protein
MDPDACLDLCLSLAQSIHDANEDGEPFDPDDAIELADHLVFLHDWIRGGGFLPKAWQR